MKTLIIVLMSLIATTTFAQISNNWIGGTPGNETSWTEARNWSNNQVPDARTHVFIVDNNSGHYAQPVIENEVEVASIQIQSGAQLIIQEAGVVVIDGSMTYTTGITSYGGKIVNNGSIQLSNVDIAGESFQANGYSGNGFVVIDQLPLDVSLLAQK